MTIQKYGPGTIEEASRCESAGWSRKECKYRIRDEVEPGSADPTLETTQKWAVKKLSWTWTNRLY